MKFILYSLYVFISLNGVVKAMDMVAENADTSEPRLPRSLASYNHHRYLFDAPHKVQVFFNLYQFPKPLSEVELNMNSTSFSHSFTEIDIGEAYTAENKKL